MSRPILLAIALLGLGFWVFLAAPSSAPAPAPLAGGASEAPNLILVTTDDQPFSSFQRRYMPRTFSRLVDEGTSFTEAAVVVPLCCPSRASLLTGQYPHNHGVLTNKPGYPLLVDKRNVLPMWLQRAGYRTAHIGKFLHGYGLEADRDPAPGWDHWFTQLAPRRYYDYRLSDDGRRVSKGSKPRDHLTEVTNRDAAGWLRRNVDSERPLFLQLDYYAPHSGSRGQRRGKACIGAAEPSPSDRRRFAGLGAPEPPSFNEADISDKPYWYPSRRLGRQELRSLDRRYRCTVASLAGVDRGIGRLLRILERSGELDETAVAFLTDNGYFFGEHRLERGKSRPLEGSVRTPLVLRLPESMRDGQVSSFGHPVASTDVVPTLLELAGAEPCVGDRCRRLDGRSLLGPSRGEEAGFSGRGVLIEMDEGETSGPKPYACAFQAVRTPTDLFVRNTVVPDRATGECESGRVFEHYEIDVDPDQLENTFPGAAVVPTVEQLSLSRRLAGLGRCSGIEGRDPPTGRPFCE